MGDLPHDAVPPVVIPGLTMYIPFCDKSTSGAKNPINVLIESCWKSGGGGGGGVTARIQGKPCDGKLVVMDKNSGIAITTTGYLQL